jgi:hypothetical protein
MLPLMLHIGFYVNRLVLPLMLETDSYTEFSSGRMQWSYRACKLTLRLLMAMRDWTAETVNDRHSSHVLVNLIVMTIPMICQVKEQTKKFLAK